MYLYLRLYADVTSKMMKDELEEIVV